MHKAMFYTKSVGMFMVLLYTNFTLLVTMVHQLSPLNSTICEVMLIFYILNKNYLKKVAYFPKIYDHTKSRALYKIMLTSPPWYY
jgi:hypothetical protein